MDRVVTGIRRSWHGSSSLVRGLAGKANYDKKKNHCIHRELISPKV